MATKRKSKARRSPLGRVLEVLADLALLALILAFGISIAARFNPEKTEASPPSSPPRAADPQPGTLPGNADYYHGSPSAGGSAGADGEGARGAHSPRGQAGGGTDAAGISPQAGRATAAGDRAATENPPAPRIRLTVDVRNGCGRVGLAEELMIRLRRAGFDVIDCRNADRHDYARTQIRDLRGNPQATTLREWMRREYGVGELVAGSGAGADVQLVLGNDLADTLRHRERAAH